MWVKDWPKEPGFYWFYGWCFRDRGEPPKHHFVKVDKGANCWLYVTNGHFMYKAEGADGWWKVVNLPDPPIEAI